MIKLSIVVLNRYLISFLLANLLISFLTQGAKSGGELESAQAKNQALKEAGAVVPTSFEAFEGAIKETFQKLVCFHDSTCTLNYIYKFLKSFVS